MDPVKLTIPAPPAHVLARLSRTSWPADAASRKGVLAAARALDDGSWEALWCWAWAAVAQLQVAGATAPEDPDAWADPKGDALLARTRAALDAMPAGERPSAVTVAALLGYHPQALKQGVVRAPSWPSRGRGRVVPLVVTVAKPAGVPDAAPARAAPAPPPEAPVGPQPPAKVLAAAGLDAWPTEPDERKRRVVYLRELAPAAWRGAIRWAYEGRAVADAAQLLGYSRVALARLVAGDAELADLAGDAPTGEIAHPPPRDILRALGLEAWPTTELKRAKAVKRAKALDDGTWERLWCWAHLAGTGVKVAGVTAPAPKGGVSAEEALGATRVAVEALPARERARHADVGARLGYAAASVARMPDRAPALAMPGQKPGSPKPKA